MTKKRDAALPGKCEPEMSMDKVHHHRGKSSASLLDKDAILRELSIMGGQTILDAGCGNGYMSKEFSELVTGTGKVYALDPDREAIAILAEETKGTNIEPLVADMTKTTSLEPQSIDLIYMSMVYHGIPGGQRNGFQKEVTRLLKPNAILAIVEIQKEADFGPPVNLKLSPAELKQAITLTPKTVVEVGPHIYMQVFQNTDGE